MHVAKRLAKRLLPRHVLGYLRQKRQESARVRPEHPSPTPGRVPTGELDRLEAVLWLGYESAARHELAALGSASNPNKTERLEARAVLARWHALHGDYESAVELLDDADEQIVSIEQELAAVRADCLVRTGEPRAALSLLAPFVHRRSADASTLIRVGCARARIDPPKNHGSGRLVEALNQIYARDGFALLRRHDVAAAVDFSNVEAPVPQYEPVDSVPPVTVIVPIDRPTKALNAALRSLSAQSWPRLEILLVGDTGEPSSRRAMETWMEKDDRIRSIDTEVGADSPSRLSAGLREAGGEYVMFHQADEWSHPQRVELMATALRSDPSVIAVGTSVVELGDDLLPRWPDPTSAASFLAPNSHSMMLRRSMLAEAGFDDLALHPTNDELVALIESRWGPDAIQWLETDSPMSLFVGEPADPRRPLAARTTDPMHALDPRTIQRWGPRNVASDAADPLDVVIAGDFVDGDPFTEDAATAIADRASRIGILLIPSFDSPHRNRERFLSVCRGGNVAFLARDTAIRCSTLVIGPSVLESPPFDALPEVRAERVVAIPPPPGRAFRGTVQAVETWARSTPVTVESLTEVFLDTGSRA